jgi:hypothetical protein
MFSIASPAFRHAGGSRYDLTTYWGRVQHFTDMVDLRNIFVTDQELADAQNALRLVKEGKRPAGVTDAQLWSMKKGG